MKENNRFLFCMVFLFIFGCSSLKNHSFNKQNSYPKLLPLWDGKSALYSRMPDYEVPVCIVQCESIEAGSNYFSLYKPYPGTEISKQEVSRWNGVTTFESGEWDGLPPRRNIVKVYSDPDEVSQIIAILYNPELPEKYIFKPECFLVVMSISSHLHSQTTLLIPFALTEDGYAVTPRGKDKTLYKILRAYPKNL